MSFRFLTLPQQITTNLVAENDTLITMRLWNSEVWNGSHWAKCKVLAGPILSWKFQRRICFLAFLASTGCLHPLVHGPFLYFQSQPLSFFWSQSTPLPLSLPSGSWHHFLSLWSCCRIILSNCNSSCIPLKRAVANHLAQTAPRLKILNLITSANVLLSYKETWP